MLSNNKINPAATELFTRVRKLNIPVVYIRINSMHYFIMKILNKRELQRITFNHSSVSDFKNFMNPYKKCTPKPHSYSFLFIDGTLSSENPSHIIIK